jgi:hypothetical protein
VIRRARPEAQWQREAIRTNLWMVPAAEVVAVTLLFVATRALDVRAYDAHQTLPPWVISGSADAARQILTTLAAALITVVGVVFSIILVALTLTSTQFGPRMLRNFIRDRGTQWTLGTFVATFVYAMLDLVAIGPGVRRLRPAHLDHGRAGLTMMDVGILIYFIHHIATMIQLPQVIASIAGDLAHAIDYEITHATGLQRPPAKAKDSSVGRRPERLRPGDRGAPRTARERGRGRAGAVQRLSAIRTALGDGAPGRRAGGCDPAAPPAGTLPGPRRAVRHGLARLGRACGSPAAEPFAHHRAVPHADPGRGLRSGPTRGDRHQGTVPAVNDTFTALTCIDWLGESLYRIAADWDPDPVCRDDDGLVRLIIVPVSYDRLVERAHEKIRQASSGMPAVMIRQFAGSDEDLPGHQPRRPTRGTAAPGRDDPPVVPGDRVRAVRPGRCRSAVSGVTRPARRRHRPAELTDVCI